MITRAAAGLVAVLAALLISPVVSAQEPVRVFAAASLTEPLTQLLTQQSGVDGIFASSGTLARQIEGGAPADIFISANPKWSNYLIEKGVARPEQGADFLRNRLVVVSPKDSAIPLIFDTTAGAAFLQDRLAMGDPDHVPAGSYAKQALQAIGLWSDLDSVAVRTANVRAALAFVEQGAVGYGIVYASDATASDKVAVVATIPEDLHQPILYTITLLSDRPEAKAVLTLLQNGDSAEVLKRFGFQTLP